MKPRDGWTVLAIILVGIVAAYIWTPTATESETAVTGPAVGVVEADRIVHLVDVNDELTRLVNVYRKALGLYEFTAEPRIRGAAEGHSLDMARSTPNPISHTGSDGSSPGERIAATGYAATVTAENIASGQPDPATVFAAWVASPPHLANIINTITTDVGFAGAVAANNAIYWCMDFALPRGN